MAAKSGMWQFLCVVFMFLVSATAKEQLKPIEINESNWSDLLEGEWLVKFYAPWCPACKAMTSTWEKVAEWSDDLEIKVGKVDVTENPGLSGRFIITALPTVFHVKNGVFRHYQGAREENLFKDYIQFMKWESVDPIPWWKSPDSFAMSALGWFFKTAMWIRNLHTTITDDYGIPAWGSYVIFAIATILLGLFLGLLIVFLCDTMFPPRPPQSPRQYSAVPRGQPPPKEESDKDDESDIIDDRQEKDDEEKEDENNDLRKRKVPTSTE